MDVLRQDLVFALRLLRRDLTYTAAVILTLGLCLAASAIIFTVVRSVLLRPLPFPESDRLVFTYDSFPGAGVERAGTSIPNHLDRAKLTHVFDAAVLFAMGVFDETVTKTAPTKPELNNDRQAEPRGTGPRFAPDE